MAIAGRLFLPLQPLHTPGNQLAPGIGLASLGQIFRCHGRRTWANSAPANRATFYFTVPG